MRIIIVEWVDSHFQPNEWCNRHYIDIVKRSPHISIGVVLAETDTELLICPNLSKEDGAQGICIPKCSIKRVRQLKVNPL